MAENALCVRCEHHAGDHGRYAGRNKLWTPHCRRRGCTCWDYAPRLDFDPRGKLTERPVTICPSCAYENVPGAPRCRHCGEARSQAEMDEPCAS